MQCPELICQLPCHKILLAVQDAHAVPWADMPAAMSQAAARPWDSRSSQLFAR